MDFLTLVLYACLQGVSEFLPISSSGHLGLFEVFLKIPADKGLTYALTVHFGTLLSVVFFLRKDLYALGSSLIGGSSSSPSKNKIISPNKITSPPSSALTSKIASRKMALRWLGFIVMANIPAAMVGIVGKSFFEQNFQNLWIIGGGFLITANVLWLMFRRQRRMSKQGNPADKSKNDSRDNAFSDIGEAPSWRVAFVVGLAQALAVFPGISRSGMTIAAGFFMGLAPAISARVSFLMAIPIIAGGFVWELLANPLTDWDEIQILLGLMMLASLVGFYALKIIFMLIKQNIFHYCAYYLWVMGIGTLIYKWMN